VPTGGRYEIRFIEDREHALRIAAVLSAHAKAQQRPVFVYVDVEPGNSAWPTLVQELQTVSLYEDGVQVAQRAASVNPSAWPGELHVGQYSGGPAADYQVTGRITGLKIYHRPLDANEIGAEAKQVPRM